MQEKSNYKTYTSPEKFYSISIPIKWEQVIVEGVPAFFEKDGNGVLQIYALKNLKSSYSLDQEMKNYLYHQHSIKSYEKVVSFIHEKKGQIRFIEFDKEDRFWLVYMLSKKDKMILITYNGQEKPESSFLQEIHLSVSSIEFY